MLLLRFFPSSDAPQRACSPFWVFPAPIPTPPIGLRLSAPRSAPRFLPRIRTRVSDTCLLAPNQQPSPPQWRGGIPVTTTGERSLPCFRWRDVPVGRAPDLGPPSPMQSKPGRLPPPSSPSRFRQSTCYDPSEVSELPRCSSQARRSSHPLSPPRFTPESYVLTRSMLTLLVSAMSPPYARQGLNHLDNRSP